MTTLFAIIAKVALAATPAAETYEAAHKVTTETGMPMVVMVSTDWCPPCQVMKKTVLPKVREHGFLKRVAFALVNPDRNSKLAENLTGGGPIPQLIMIRRTSRGWRIGQSSITTILQAATSLRRARPHS